MVLTVNVSVESVLPLLLRQIENAVHNHLVRMVVEQDVDAAHLAQRLVHNLLAVGLLLQIHSQQVDLAAVALDFLLRLLGVLLLLRQVRDQSLGALHGEEDGCRLADSTVSTCDDRLLAIELAGCLVDLVAAIFGGESFGCWLLRKVGFEAGSVLVADRGLVAWEFLSVDVSLHCIEVSNDIPSWNCDLSEDMVAVMGRFFYCGKGDCFESEWQERVRIGLQCLKEMSTLHGALLRVRRKS